MGSAPAKEKIGDAALAAKTGKTWQEWFALLDKAGAKQMDHKSIAALLAKRFGAERGWWWQMITVGYEQARGKRLKHQKPEGFEVSASKTIGAPMAALYKAWTDEKLRKRWLADARLTIRKATPNKSVRIAWDAGASRVDVMFYPKGTARNQVTVQHGRLANATAAERTKTYWKGQLEKLATLLER